MDYVPRSQTIGVGYPALNLFTVFSGILADAYSAEFTVHDSGGTQTFPGVGREAVNMVDHRIGVGHYVATWAVPSNEPLGLHEIRWFYKETDVSDEVTLTQTFEVRGSAPAPSVPTYASIAQLREEGVTEDEANDTRLLSLIQQASTLIEKITGRHFEPRALTLYLDGTGSRKLLLAQPIIAIASVAIDAFTLTGGETGVDAELYRVYNRHLTQGLLHPDDRNNPKLEFFHGRDLYGYSESDGILGITFDSLIFPVGPQSVRVTGLFGYTDPDGTPLGSTPVLIGKAAMLMVIRSLVKLADADALEDAQRRHRLVQEKTRDQSYTLTKATDMTPAYAHVATGYFTGDPIVDNILATYMRPPALGAA